MKVVIGGRLLHIHMQQIHVQKYTTKIREMYMRNPEIYEIGSGTKLLFTFLSLKVFRHEERETQFLSVLTFHHVRPPLQTTGLLGEVQNDLPSSRLESQLYSEFKSQLYQRTGIP